MGKILKGLMFNNEISVSLLDTTDVVNTAIKYHSLSPVTSATLGRVLTVTSFMATSLKNEDDSLSITINGDGVGGQIVTCSDSSLSVRGYIENPQVDIPKKPNGKLDVGACVGKGRISVVKNMGLKEPYTGSCHITSGEIAEDFASYYTYSEQQPTGLALGVKIGVDHFCVGAGGLVLQPLPDASEESISSAEELLSHFNEISSMIETDGIEGIRKQFFEGVEFTEYKTEYKCNCSNEKIDKVLLTLGKEELYNMIEKDGKIEVTCNFCPKKYIYLKKDIDNLLK